MTRDEQFIIENAAADDDLDVLLATHRCADCAEFAFLEVGSEGVTVWLCEGCADERDLDTARGEHEAAARAA